MNEISEIKQLQKSVIEGDYCIGCGACAEIDGSPFKVKMNEFGNYVAYLDNTENADEQVKLLDICPFSGESKNEDELGKLLFPENTPDKHIGNFIQNYTGYVAQGDYRSNGSSGGFGKWLGHALLREGMIDYFIQLAPNRTDRSDVPLFNYQVFDSPEEVIKGSKSSYYPVTLENAVKQISEVEGRYAITGVPCFIKTLRLLSLKNKALNDRIKFTIGIVCGGMKSANQAKMIGWQLGVHPDNLISIDFRRKHKDKPASQKIYQVWSNKDDKERFKPSTEIIGTGWQGYFRPNPCDYCDDVVAELADVSLGDAWLPEYVNDPRGTSILIVRNRQILELIEKYRGTELKLNEVSKEDVIKSQSGGYRHRREALSFRIAKKGIKGEWFPKKRVKANEFNITRQRKKIYTIREEIALKSQLLFIEALKLNNIDHFVKEVTVLSKKYSAANKSSLSKIKRLLRKIKNGIKG